MEPACHKIAATDAHCKDYMTSNSKFKLRLFIVRSKAHLAIQSNGLSNPLNQLSR